ncbi:chemotaxis protein CheA [Pseudotabrizicola sediminis]|uniref:Chemotaxis protein CheA n=1 Tax=Pseudotabrizicola sediminis TaxID=2486418 RepID=A0ABY2KHX6_9RHOB|nr:chemotaxis protein CheA [Pseudotabrizicola sediminis]TGD41915.1 chemotaxis protein CheA [Pseudotabrizicola sediminis]
MTTDLSAAVETFVQEAREQLEGLEAMLLDLETGTDRDRVDAIFRVLHTVKGSGSMFGFGALARFTHHFEDAFDGVREGRMQIDNRLIDVSLRARDHMTALLDCGGDNPEAARLEASDEAASLLATLAAIMGKGPASAESKSSPARAALPQREVVFRRWSIRFHPDAAALRNGMRPDLLMAELAALGEAEIRLDASELPVLAELDPERSYLAWDIILATAQPRDAIEAIFLFADDAALEITEIFQETQETADTVPTVPTQQPKAQKTAVVPQEPPAARVPQANAGSSENVRVPAGKLDDIMDQLGELVIAQARLHQIAAATKNADLESIVEEVERLVTGLRDATLSVRMLPIESVFGKFRRVVRDLSVELGKDVALAVEGGETELDKTVIDRLSEPLVHMIRNSMDHGLEDAARRQASGKPARGKVTLSARQEGGEVLISIEDDGAGLDTDAICKRAIERGLLAADAQPNPAEIHQMIFAPGFSTASTLSSVSGRGVGMDAVRSAVEALRGQTEIVTVPGRGTRVTLRLPVTLAIIDGFLVRLGQSVFVIPLAAVEECVEFEEAERGRESGRTMLQLREHLVPFLDLDEVFSRPRSTEARRRVVIVKADGQRLGLVVDDILGQNQTVIKTLSIYHRHIAGLAGATILGDGAVALIIDVATLARRARVAQRQIA